MLVRDYSLSISCLELYLNREVNNFNSYDFGEINSSNLIYSIYQRNNVYFRYRLFLKN